MCRLQSQRALTLYTSDRLRCCDRYIRCQRPLAVKPLNSTRDVRRYLAPLPLIVSGAPGCNDVMSSVQRVLRRTAAHVQVQLRSATLIATVETAQSRPAIKSGIYTLITNILFFPFFLFPPLAIIHL